MSCLYFCHLCQRHPEDVCPRGATLRIQLCRVRWDKEPSPVPRGLALGVPCYGFNCAGSGGTGNRPLSHNRNTGVYQERDPSKTPRGRLPSGCRAIRSFVPNHVGQGTGPCQDERTVPLSFHPCLFMSHVYPPPCPTFFIIARLCASLFLLSFLLQ